MQSAAEKTTRPGVPVMMIQTADRIPFFQIRGTVDDRQEVLAWKGGLYYGWTRSVDKAKESARGLIDSDGAIRIGGDTFPARPGKIDVLIALAGALRLFGSVDEIKTNYDQIETLLAIIYPDR